MSNAEQIIVSMSTALDARNAARLYSADDPELIRERFARDRLAEFWGTCPDENVRVLVTVYDAAEYDRPRGYPKETLV